MVSVRPSLKYVVCFTTMLVGTWSATFFLLDFALTGVDAIMLMSTIIKVQIACFILQLFGFNDAKLGKTI
jgi:hypothetical protein